MMDLELLSVLAADKVAYPKEEMDALWRVILINQFHDILPGSAIHEVYEVTKGEYASIAEKIGRHEGRAPGCPDPRPARAVTVFNTTGFARNDVVTLPGVQAEALTGRDRPHLPGAADRRRRRGPTWKNLPAKGRKGFAKAAAQAAEAPFAPVRRRPIRWRPPSTPSVSTKNGQIAAMFDKGTPAARCSRQARPATPCACSRTKPIYYDNWDIDNYYTEKFWDVTDVKDFTWTETARCAPPCTSSAASASPTICQDMPLLRQPAPRGLCDHRGLEGAPASAQGVSSRRTCTPTRLPSRSSTANLTRKTHSNTSWDRARFESCGQKWCDVSEGHYGVSVLNDCKYGPLGSRTACIGLTLIKSGIEPNPVTDQEVHTFTYALYPHQEGLGRPGGTVPPGLLPQPARAGGGRRQRRRRREPGRRGRAQRGAGDRQAGRGRRRRDPAPVRVRERQDPRSP